MFIASTVQVCQLLLRRHAGRHSQFPADVINRDTTRGTHKVGHRNASERRKGRLGHFEAKTSAVETNAALQSAKARDVAFGS